MKIISMLKLKKWSLEGAKLMAVFSIDLPGRVKNFELPRTKPLMPLFETIVNSIYAIEERQQNDDKVNGYINIEIIREPQMRVQTEGIDSSINDMNALKRSLKKSNLRLEMKTFHYCIRRLKMLHLGQANCIYMLMIEWFKK